MLRRVLPLRSARHFGTTSAAVQFSPRRHHQRQRRQPQIRIEDRDVASLLSVRAPSDRVVQTCRTLRKKDEIAVLAATDPRAWNLALQRRLEQRDERGAAELLALVASFAPENTSEPVWTDLLFTMVRRRSGPAETQQLLDQLQKRYGAQFVARVLVAVVNGCGNANMFDTAKHLLLYQQNLWQEVRDQDKSVGSTEPIMCEKVVGHLLSKMVQKKKYQQALELAEEYFSHKEFDAVRDFQQQGFLALFRACEATRESPRRVVRTFIDYVERCAENYDVDDFRGLVPERGFGAAIQCCVKLEEFSLAQHCYSVMEKTRMRLVGRNDKQHLEFTEEKDSLRSHTVDEVLPMDENMNVNVMKSCTATNDFVLLKKVFRGMAAHGVARSAGFGSAIRYCHENLDADFLEEVLADAFATEHELQSSWMLEVPNYNDALGCFAETKRFDQAKDLFSHMLDNPFITPDHITMLEMVENHRDASVEELFELMDVFLEWKLAPNLQVFTSLLSICMRRRVVGDAVALIDAMKQRNVVLDVKAFTTVAFIHASQGDLKAVADVVREMENSGVMTDQLFFDYIMNGVYGSCGIDMCFSLFREMNLSNVTIPKGLYVSLVDLGTKIGLIERTLHIAYNMECEGFSISPEQLHELMVRCHSDTEMSEFMRTFSLLHQGAQPDTPRFEVELYEDLISTLARLNRKNDVTKVQQLAKSVGYDDLIV